MAKKGSTAYVGINANTKGFEMGLRRLTRGFSNINRGGGRLAAGGLRRGFSGLRGAGVGLLGAAGLGFGFTKLVQTFARWSPEFNKAFVAITSAIRDTIRPHIEKFGEFLLTKMPEIKKGLGEFVDTTAALVEGLRTYWTDPKRDTPADIAMGGAMLIDEATAAGEAFRDAAFGSVLGSVGFTPAEAQGVATGYGNMISNTPLGWAFAAARELLVGAAGADPMREGGGSL